MNYDKIKGSWRSEIIEGTSGKDMIVAGRGNDELYGNGGHDWLKGGDGEDRLDGGRGNDRLTGGANEDTFIFNDNSGGTDRITDFEDGEHIIWNGTGRGEISAFWFFPDDTGDILFQLDGGGSTTFVRVEVGEETFGLEDLVNIGVSDAAFETWETHFDIA